MLFFPGSSHNRSCYGLITFDKSVASQPHNQAHKRGFCNLIHQVANKEVCMFYSYTSRNKMRLCVVLIKNLCGMVHCGILMTKTCQKSLGWTACIQCSITILPITNIISLIGLLLRGSGCSRVSGCVGYYKQNKRLYHS